MIICNAFVELLLLENELLFVYFLWIHAHLEELQKVFKMTGVKLTIGRLSVIGIY